MVRVEEAAAEAETACKLAAIGLHTSVTALDAAIRLVRDPDEAMTARRVAAMAQHIAVAVSELAASVESGSTGQPAEAEPPSS